MSTQRFTLLAVAFHISHRGKLIVPLLLDHCFGGGDTGFQKRMRSAQQPLKFCCVKSDCCYSDGK